MRTFVLLLLLTTLAQSEELTVFFRTEPDRVRVFQKLSHGAPHFRGLSDQPVSVEDVGTDLVLTFEKEGFESPQPLRLPTGTLKGRSSWPPANEPPIRLPPTHAGAALRHFLEKNPATVGLSLVASLIGLGLGWFRLRTVRRRLAHQERLEELAPAHQTRHDSLLMRTLSGYRLVDVLGQGGMACVYLGIPDQSLDKSQSVAVKILDRKLSEQADFIRRFKREIQVSASLDHPHIMRLIDWGETVEGWIYLIMEFVEGGVLRDRVGPGGLPLNRACTLMDEIFSAVAYAHQRGIIHRDLKPDNIMLTKKGSIKVMDFGLAKNESSEKLTQTGVALGTPAYMAPEQIQSLELDARTDQYALGCLAYELLTGRLPFEADSPTQLIFLHLTDEPDPPSFYRPELPAPVDAVVLKMLAKDKEDRYPDLESARTDLIGSLGLEIAKG